MGIFDGIKGFIQTLGPMLGPIGGVASSLIDAASQRGANAQNIQEAQKNRDFQAAQSSTQYQRGVEDLKKAGLNPGLAYQGASDNAASGSQATVQPTIQNTATKFATALDTYNSLATGAAQRELIREQTNAASADAHLKLVNAALGAPEAQLGTNPDYLQQFSRTKFAELKQRTAQATNYPAQFRATINNLNANTASAQAAAANARSLTTLNEQQATNEWFRKNVQPYINSTAATIKPFMPFTPRITYYR